MTKSELFTQFNKAKVAARAGKLDPKRVNRALGLSQMKASRPYHTMINSCDCPDQLYRPNVICAHRIAAMIEYRATHASQPKTPPEPVKVKPILVLMTGAEGDSYCAEQVAGGYYIHTWNFIWEAEQYITSHPAICWVRPTSATGRRQRPDQVHPIGG